MVKINKVCFEWVLKIRCYKSYVITRHIFAGLKVGLDKVPLLATQFHVLHLIFIPERAGHDLHNGAKQNVAQPL